MRHSGCLLRSLQVADDRRRPLNVSRRSGYIDELDVASMMNYSSRRAIVDTEPIPFYSVSGGRVRCVSKSVPPPERTLHCRSWRPTAGPISPKGNFTRGRLDFFPHYYPRAPALFLHANPDNHHIVDPPRCLPRTRKTNPGIRTTSTNGKRSPSQPSRTSAGPSAKNPASRPSSPNTASSTSNNPGR
ncbi:hypothetical protein KC338_g30 [Hortaea werneckii]|nr:hypothetical protein KC338_g30 [Hortaea werneckii]